MAALRESPPDVVHHGLGLGPGLDEEPCVDVLLGEGEGVLDHLRDLSLAQAVGRLDLDGGRLAGPQLLRLDLQDAVGIDQERHLDLGHPGGHGIDPGQIEARERAVVLGQLALPLQHVHVDGGLAVHGGREVLLRQGRDGRIARDQDADDAAEGLDSERQRRHVEQQHVRDATGQDLRLHRCAERDDLVGVELAVRRLAEETLDPLANQRHPGRSSDQHDLVDLSRFEVRVLERHPARPERGVHERRDQPFQLGARDLAPIREPLERDDQHRPLLGRQPALRGLGPEPQFLHCLEVGRQIRAVDRLDVFEEPLRHRAVEVVATEVRVAVGGEHLEDAVVDPEDRDVEGSAAQVVDRDHALREPLEPIGQRRGGRLVDDPQHVQPGDAAGVLGRLALGVVEIGGHGDDGTLDRLAQVGLGLELERAQDLRRHLGRRHLAVARADRDDLGARHDLERHVARLLANVLPPSPHEALDRADGARRISRELPARRLANHDAVGRVGHDRRQELPPLGVGNNAGHTAGVHVCDEAVGGPEVNADDARHGSLRPLPAPE